jgi:hypothetical protein
MNFPRLVFRCPGTELCVGGTYSYKSVIDQEQFEISIADGWHSTLPDALSPPVIIHIETLEVPSQIAEPDELSNMPEPVIAVVDEHPIELAVKPIIIVHKPHKKAKHKRV